MKNKEFIVTARISGKTEVPKLVDAKDMMIESVSDYTDEIVKRIHKNIKNDGSIDGCYHYIIRELYKKHGKDIKDTTPLKMELSDFADFAGQKLADAADLIFEGIVIGMLMAIKQKEALDMVESDDKNKA